MVTGRRWWGASLGMALLLGSYGLRAQEVIKAPQGGVPALPGAPAHNGGHGGAPEGHNGHEKHEKHEEHEDEHEEHEEGEKEEEKVGGLILEFDFLAVRPRRRPHDFAILDPTNDAAVNGSLVNFDWKLTGGYRVAAGWKLNHGWEIKGVYTYVHSNDEASIAPPANGALYATLSAPLTFDAAGGAQGSSNIDLDLIDAEFAKRWCASECFWLRAAGGVRVITVQQKTNVFYDFTGAGLGGSTVGQRIQFDGVGPRVGGDGFFRVWERLGFWAKAYGALMAGDFVTNTNQTVNDGRSVVVDVNDKFWKVVPNLELAVGAGWQSENISLKVGYEMQHFFGLVDNVDFPDQATFKNSFRTGDVSLEAVTVSLGIYY